MCPATDKQTVKLKSDSDRILISNDGEYLVAMNESSVVAYRAGTPEPILFKGMASELFRNASFLPNGEIVVGGEKEAGVWNLGEGIKRLSLKAPGGVETVAASPDGLLIAGVSRDDGRIWVWETQKGDLIKESAGNINSLRPSVTFADPTHLLVYEISESRARIINVDTATMKFNPSQWQPAGSGATTNLTFGVSGKWLEAGSTDREITEPELLVFDAKTGVQAGTIKLGDNGTGAMIDGNRAIAVSANGAVNLIDLTAGKSEKVLDLSGRSKLAAVSSNGKFAAIKLGDRDVFIYPIPGGQK